MLYRLGLAHNLRWVSDNEINKAKLQVEQLNLSKIRNEVLYSKGLNKNLPQYSWADVRTSVALGKALVVVEQKVYDVSGFLDQHPGGRLTILHRVGTDVSDAFRGRSGEHIHTKAAESFLKGYLVGRLVEPSSGAVPSRNADVADNEE